MNKASERQARYDKDNTTRVYLKLNNKTDKRIIDWLNNQPNKQGAIKNAIARDMSRGTLEKYLSEGWQIYYADKMGTSMFYCLHKATHPVKTENGISVVDTGTEIWRDVEITVYEDGTEEICKR